MFVIQYKITNEELAVFARKIYEEACYGYLDLKDSVCERLVKDFIAERQIVDGTEINSQGYSGNFVYSGPENNSDTWIYPQTYNNSSIANINIYASDLTSISLRDEPSVSPRVENQVRENNF